ncbi:hypothetical protein BCR41DRAFT_401628 [Lobosporangium transversale]|uniref:RNase H type-1 domain-containing protein n=1 Tax=Lobosporangium transversale TaxID=64571 RepID=A0A1Y2G7F2_9FUNG|nr:hypothetical protein BCR41DRAFT_401628 [Lobosporangium transversale]ORY99787.1 hypothetical protein BCR41DRAFT_401628 [Lobosporangium transversale]|eukprot:XP_021876021.1 hypothetical protein BCR41DRAFT_401628 [Lobosporangium transversale]
MNDLNPLIIDPITSRNNGTGVVIDNETAKMIKDLGVLGTIEGHVSSTTAEAAGLLSAICSCPRGRKATIFCDCKPVVDQFAVIAKSTEKIPTRWRCADLWHMIYEAYEKQGRRITVQWTPSHSGKDGNTIADQWANKAHSSGLASWRIKKATGATK